MAANGDASAADKLIESVRDRPGTALALAAGLGLATGVFAGVWLHSTGRLAKYSSDKEEATRLKKRQGPHIEDDGDTESRFGDNASISGSSTPASNMTGSSSYFSLSRELDDRLDYSLALIYRHDLSLGKGRLVALCTQAALGQFKKLWKGKSEDLKLWEKGSKAKLCLQAEDENHLMDVEEAALNAGLPTFKVKDVSNNRRVVAVMALGPAKSSRLKEVTSNLKLLL